MQQQKLSESAEVQTHELRGDQTQNVFKNRTRRVDKGFVDLKKIKGRDGKFLETTGEATRNQKAENDKIDYMREVFCTKKKKN